MRVLITGGTGFVGAWTAKAVADAGHQVRFLVRDAARLDSSAAMLGVDISDHVTGDITDRDSVLRSLDGCDAVIHCAAVVATDPRRSNEIIETNLAGARNVLGGAVEQGLDLIVHVSSITALFAPDLEVMSADLEVVGGTDAYGRSKAAVERYARGLQDDGAPVIITYPGMVLGPGAGKQFGEVADGVEKILKTRMVPGTDASWLVIDVRDLAEIHAKILTADGASPRYMAGGRHIDAAAIHAIFSRATGRTMLRLPVPGVLLRLTGSAVDTVCRVVPVTSVLTRAAMDYYTRMPASDDRPVHTELGIEYRDLDVTFADCIADLQRCGRVSHSQAGL